MSPASLQHQHSKAWSYYLSEFLLWTIVNILINQSYKQSLTYGKFSKTNCKKCEFPLTIYLLRKKRMGKLAEEKAQRFDLGTIQIIFMFIFVYPHSRISREEGLHTGSAVRGHVSSPLKPPAYGWWFQSRISYSGMQEKDSRASKQTEWVYLWKSTSCIIQDCSLK